MAATSIEKLQKKLSKEPNSLVFMQLADEYRKDGQVNDALRVLQDGLKRHPNYWTARVSVGRIYYENADLVRALEELEIVVRAVPGNLLANRMLGDIYLRQNRPQEALRRYKIVQMLNPADQEVSAHIQKLETHLSDARSAETAPTVMIPAPKLPVVEELPAELVEESVPPAEQPSAEAEIPQIEIEMQPVVTAIADTQAAVDAAIRAELQTEEQVPVTTPLLAVEMEEFVDLGTIGPPDEDSYWSIQESISQPVPVTDIAPMEPPAFATPEVPWNRTNEMPMGEEPRQPDLSGIAGMFLNVEPDSNELVDVREIPVISADQEILEDSFEELDSGELEQVLEESQEEIPPDRTQPMEEEESEADESADELTSESLAELYASQGLTDRAIKVYQKMLLTDPNNRRIVQRLQELNPIDAFLAAAAQEEARTEREQEPVLRWESADSMIPVRSDSDSHTDDRRKKITTLENWLASIRRERS